MTILGFCQIVSQNGGRNLSFDHISLRFKNRDMNWYRCGKGSVDIRCSRLPQPPFFPFPFLPFLELVSEPPALFSGPESKLARAVIAVLFPRVVASFARRRAPLMLSAASCSTCRSGKAALPLCIAGTSLRDETYSRRLIQVRRQGAVVDDHYVRVPIKSGNSPQPHGRKNFSDGLRRSQSGSRPPITIPGSGGKKTNRRVIVRAPGM